MVFQLQRTTTGDDVLYSTANTVPSLDLRFATNKTLNDYVSGTNLITFTRASSGTYVGSDKLIKTATTNLLLRSEEFGTTWINTALIIGTAATQAPNGSVTGTSIVPTTASALHRIQQTISITAGTIYTASVYAKANGYNYLYLNAQSPFAARATFNLATGAISAIGSGTATMVAVGNGWYRCSVTGTAVSTQTSGPFFQVNSIQTGATDDTYTGDGTSGIYLWGAQLEQSSTVGEYIPTTSTINSAPRFDHNPTTGESLGLLVEEQRTNSLTGSQDFSNTYWNNSNSTRTNNSSTAPDNTTTACLVAGLGTTYGGLVRRYTTFAASTTYTFSCFAKAGTISTIGLRLTTSCINSDNYCYYNLATGVATAITPSAGTVVAVSMTAFPNGWYRCVLTYTTSASQGALDLADIALTTNTGNVNYTGTGNALIWGAMLESGASFPTSYIPTTTATVTRSADVASITGANFSSWYNQTEGTVYWEGNPFASTETGYFGVQDAGSTSFFRLSRSFNQARNIVSVSSVNQADLYSGNTVTLGANNKFATAVKANDFALSLAGGTVATDTSGTVPTVDRATIGTGAFLTQLNGTIRRLTYWPQRLANATLQSITT